MRYETESLINNVEIVEPPITELKKRGRWMTTACLSGAGCVILFIAGIVIGIKIFIGAGPKQIKNLPPEFPAEIPLYDQYNIDKITYVSGKYKSRSVEIAALFPKIVLSPLIYSEQTPPATQKKTGIISTILELLIKPVSDSRNMIQIEWFDISSHPDEMVDYYQNKLKNAGFNIDSETKGELYRQFTFKRGDYLSGTVYVESSEKNTINYAFIIVNLPPEINTKNEEMIKATSTPNDTEHDTF